MKLEKHLEMLRFQKKVAWRKIGLMLWSGSLFCLQCAIIYYLRTSADILQALDVDTLQMVCEVTKGFFLHQ